MTTDLSKGVSSPGHNSIVRTKDGKLWIVYHRHTDPACPKPSFDRVVCIDRLFFDKKRQTEDGRPDFDAAAGTVKPIAYTLSF